MGVVCTLRGAGGSTFFLPSHPPRRLVWRSKKISLTCLQWVKNESKMDHTYMYTNTAHRPGDLIRQDILSNLLVEVGIQVVPKQKYDTHTSTISIATHKITTLTCCCHQWWVQSHHRDMKSILHTPLSGSLESGDQQALHNGTETTVQPTHTHTHLHRLHTTSPGSPSQPDQQLYCNCTMMMSSKINWVLLEIHRPSFTYSSLLE